MRKLLAITLFATACTNVPSNENDYDSVRQRLTDEPTSLYVRSGSSFGTITARRRLADGWSTAETPLEIERGYVRTSIDANGQLAIQRLELDLAPIELGLFERPARLQDVHVRLVKPVVADVAWMSEDDATTAMAMPFEFDWSVKFQGDEPYALATQRLPETSAEVLLAGDGNHVAAQIDVTAAGELWNWADILEMTDISISLDAATAY
jgi:hypothetical protein